MSLHRLYEEVSYAIGTYTKELYLLLAFVEDIDKYIICRQEEHISDLLDAMPSKVLTELHSFFQECLDNFKQAERIIKEDPSSISKKRYILKGNKANYSPEAERYFLRYIFATYKPVTYPELLYSVALTHTIVVFESFLNDFLIAIFTYRPDTLKSESTATYKNILSFGSMKELIGYLATTKAKKFLDENIDEVVDKLKKDFNFDVSGFKQFNILREASYRRNIVVHNRGITDKDYCQKILGSQIGVTLSTDFQYIETLTTVIGRFIDHLDNHFSRKMHYMRHPMQNWILNPPPC